MKRRLCVIFCLLLLWLHGGAFAAFLADSPGGFFMRSRGIAVSKLITLLGKSYHVPAVISHKVAGVFSGEIKNTSFVRALNNLANEFDLAWYYNGNTLYVDSAQEITSKIFIPTYTSAKNLYDNIKSGISLSSRFNALELRKFAKSISASGTPEFIADVTGMAQTLDTQQYKEANNKVVIKIFPLLYANANDIKYDYGGKNTVIPGIVKEVQDLLNNSGGGAQDNKKTEGSLPKITIDERQNAITIMGLESKMKMYSDLIEQLDKPQQPINISVKIIDVNVGDLDSLGVQWSVSKQTAAGSVEFNNVAMSPGGSVSAVIKNTKGFIITVNALESQAKAHIISSPSVFTLNNMPAILSRSTTFYARLEGKNSVKLQKISTGESLRVLPHLIYNKTPRKEILLTLSIEDGAPANNMQQIDNLPQTQNSQISTIAKLKEGQSLLVGGFIRNKELTSKRKIPLLGDIPLIGNLFDSSTLTKQSLVRLFLIQATPVNI